MEITPPVKPALQSYLQILLYTSIILYLGKLLFIPLFFGLLVAIVMHPICKWFELRGMRKPLAIGVCMIMVAILLGGLGALVFWQVTLLANEGPALISRLAKVLPQLQEWVSANLGIPLHTGNDWGDRLVVFIGGNLSSTLQSTFNALFMLFLTPVYTALIMYHRRVLVQYLKLVIPQAHQAQFDIIVNKIIHTYFDYIKGMVLVYLIVGILNSVGLMLLGVENAVLYGMLCSVMTIVPYVGLILSALLPISVVWIETGNILFPIGVVAVFTVVQYLEANVIFPKIVGTQLNVSTLAMLVAIIAGGIIWGVAGMVLFIPFVAILKIMSDHIAEWKPFNLLLGRT